MDFSLPHGRKRVRFDQLYRPVELYKALVRAYTKPLFSWRKALSRSHDGRTLYDFARHTPQNAETLHRALASHAFHFREGLELRFNFNGKLRRIYLFPWEERIADLLVYRLLNRHFHSVFSPDCYAYRYRGFGIDVCQRRIARTLAHRPKDSPVYGFKRDIRDYFPSIDHDVLIGAVKQWVDPDDYLFQLLSERIRFCFRDDDGTHVAARGVPFGTAVACFLANLYLTPVDRMLAGIEGAAHFRYGDDILVLSDDRDAALTAARTFDAAIAQLRLQSKPSHHQEFRLGEDGAGDAIFEPVRKFRHLGLEFRGDGSVGLPRDKFRKIRNLFRFAFRRARRRFRRVENPLKRAALAVDISRAVLDRGFRSVAIIDYYLKHVDDEDQLKLLDRWLAEEVLALSFRNGHKKGSFRQLSFSKLRSMGLPSLRHRHRLIRHGHVRSSFFVLRSERMIEIERGRLPGGADRARASAATP